MGQPAFKIEHPHITRTDSICSGQPIIAGTRVPVWTIVGYYFNLKYSVDQIIEAIPHITHAQIHDALSYYYDNKQEIDDQIRINNDEEYWKKLIPTKRGQMQKGCYENKTLS